MEQIHTRPESDLVMAVAAEVRAHLARRRISGRKAAEALGWNHAYMNRRMTGATALDVADLGALADLLGVEVTAFFEGPGVPAGIRDDRVKSRYPSMSLLTCSKPGAVKNLQPCRELAAVA